MSQIHLSLDSYRIPKKEREEIVKLISSSKVKTTVSEGDLGAKGGISWFPTDLIILITGLTAAGFFNALGKNIYKKFTSKIKQLLAHSTKKEPVIHQAFISFGLKKVTLYFQFDWANVNNLETSLNKLKTAYPIIEKEVLRLLKFKPEKLTGKFESITFIYDDLDKQWIISHFNRH